MDMSNLNEHIETNHLETVFLVQMLENQKASEQNLEKFKVELTDILRTMIDNQNAIKQELFIMRQDNHKSVEKIANIEERVDKLSGSLTKISSTASPEPQKVHQQPKVPAPSGFQPQQSASRISPEKVLSPEPSPTPISTSIPPPSSGAPQPAGSSLKSTPNQKIEKILLVGDSISGQLHTKTIEVATNAKLRTAKAYSSIFENTEDKVRHAPRFPGKNFNDVIAKELNKEEVDVLIVQAGSVDITNMKTDGHYAEHVEHFKQQTVVSANNLFMAVSNAALNNTHLKKIIILKQIPRYDVL